MVVFWISVNTLLYLNRSERENHKLITVGAENCTESAPILDIKKTRENGIHGYFFNMTKFFRSQINITLKEVLQETH